MIIHNAALAASVLGECDGRGEARIRAREWAVLCFSSTGATACADNR